MASFSASDLTYVIAEYRTMAELCAGRPMGAAQVEALVEAGRLPAATYVLPVGQFGGVRHVTHTLRGSRRYSRQRQ
jgi:hypothetical protein